MSQSNPQDFYQLAMLAELARPLAHECNNFLNTLLLQLAISERSFPESSRAEWANIRREAKKLANLFQQWQRQPKQVSEESPRIEVHQLLQQTVKLLREDTPALQVVVRTSGESPWLTTAFPGELQCLISLVLRYAYAAMQASGIDNPAIEMELGKSRDRIQLRLCDSGTPKQTLRWADFDDVASSERVTLSLPALACRSLVDRLDGVVRIEREADDRIVLAIELPRSDG